LSRGARAPAIEVRDRGGLRWLHVGGEAIQSAMRIAEPAALALDYTRAMMAFLLLHPEPRRALLIGLGGGSLAKFIHKHLRRTRVRAVEQDPRIVAVARERFALPPEDARLHVEIGDGAEALAPECCDLLMVDAYRDELHVPELASRAFYDAAWLSLEAPGAAVVNFMDDDPQLDRQLRRLETAFGGAVLAFHAPRDPNVIALALKGFAPRIEWEALRRRARALQARYGVGFEEFVPKLRRMNRHTPLELFLAPS